MTDSTVLMSCYETEHLTGTEVTFAMNYLCLDARSGACETRVSLAFGGMTDLISLT